MDNLYESLFQICVLRAKLNKKIKNGVPLNDVEVLRISKQLDEALKTYHKNIYNNNLELEVVVQCKYKRECKYKYKYKCK